MKTNNVRILNSAHYIPVWRDVLGEESLSSTNDYIFLVREKQKSTFFMKNPPAEIKMRKRSCKHRKWKQRCRRLTHFLLNVFENSSDPCGIKANIGKINNVLIMPGRLSLHCARLLAGPGWPTSGNMSHVHPPTHGVNSPGERLLKFTLSSPMRCTCTAKAATLKHWDH